MMDLQHLLEIGAPHSHFFHKWWADNLLGGFDKEARKHVFLTPGRWTVTDVTDFWRAQDEPWFLNLDCLSYAPELSPVALPLLTRLDELLLEGSERWRRFAEGKGGSSGESALKIVGILKVGIMATIAEFPVAPAWRCEAIQSGLAQAGTILHSFSYLGLAEHLNTEGLATSRMPGAVERPGVVGFAEEETMIINEALDWIAQNLRPVIPRRRVTISPLLDDSENLGHTSTWTGDIQISAAITRRATLASLAKTLVHELMHAKPDLWGRAKQGVRILLTDDEEHEFIRNAGLAASVMFDGQPLGQANRILTFDSETGEPVLVRSDGSGRLTLPSWSAVREAFIFERNLGPLSDFLRLHQGRAP